MCSASVWNVPVPASHVLSLKPIDVDDQRVAFPTGDRIAHVARNQIVGMFRGERNHAEDVHVLVEHHDLRRGLDDLLREEAQHDGPRNASGQALAAWDRRCLAG